MRFEWNPEKEQENVKKHNGITFKEASEVFLDENSLEDYDDEHSDFTEQRYVRIGNSAKRLLRVSFTIKESEIGTEVIRIISARKGKTQEEKIYDEENRKNQL
jgi:uncharacterized protein